MKVRDARGHQIEEEHSTTKALGDRCANFIEKRHFATMELLASQMGMREIRESRGGGGRLKTNGALRLEEPDAVGVRRWRRQRVGLSLCFALGCLARSMKTPMGLQTAEPIARAVGGDKPSSMA